MGILGIGIDSGNVLLAWVEEVLSTQTIYNCRSITKGKAINRETFDEDVQKLCTVIR